MSRVKLRSLKKYCWNQRGPVAVCATSSRVREDWARSEEHTSELQSPCNLVCRLLLEKKKKTQSKRPRCYPISINSDFVLPILSAALNIATAYRSTPLYHPLLPNLLNLLT